MHEIRTMLKKSVNNNKSVLSSVRKGERALVPISPQNHVNNSVESISSMSDWKVSVDHSGRHLNSYKFHKELRMKDKNQSVSYGRSQKLSSKMIRINSKLKAIYEGSLINKENEKYRNSSVPIR